MESKSTIVHATAECSAYLLSMNVFKPNKFTDNFIWGVKNAISSGDWSMFFRIFGTHFAYEVLLGGRALQETSYTFEAM